MTTTATNIDMSLQKMIDISLEFGLQYIDDNYKETFKSFVLHDSSEESLHKLMLDESKIR